MFFTMDGNMQKKMNYSTYCLKIKKIETKNVTTRVSALIVPQIEIIPQLAMQNHLM